MSTRKSARASAGAAAPAARTPPRASAGAPSRAAARAATGTARSRYGYAHLVAAIAEHARSARCVNELDRLVVLERMRLVFGSEPEVLLRRGFDKAYRQVVEGV